ncbi:MAG: hypothetical protein LBR07_09255 [Puniceicoccales bacterium]|jgi:type II secretory pathway pseudopilin PulG|nr:hypothetical protein [Puniceicoccales bacterium]
MTRSTRFFCFPRLSRPSRPRRAATGGAAGGFTLVEVILAVGILAIAILTLAGLVGSVFQQVESVVRTNRALAAVNAINTALETPELIAGTKLPKVDDPNTAKFDVVYTLLRDAVGTKRVNLFFFSRRLPDAAGTGYTFVDCVYNTNGETLTKSRYDEMKGYGPVFRVEMGIARMLENQRIELDQTTARPKDTKYKVDEPLPGTAGEYALAFLPLYLEIFPYTPGAGVGSEQKYSRPILGQNIAVSR